jgi:hypothetical protein
VGEQNSQGFDQLIQKIQRLETRNGRHEKQIT